MISISCVCLTYSKNKELEEAIESFLRQTYQGKKELVIINDCDDQFLEFNHPEVFILNSSRRFNSIGEKRNISVSLSKYDYIAVWDDDDISLPHRLEFCANKIKENNFNYYKFNDAWFYSKIDKIKRKTTNAFHGCSIFSKDLFRKTNGYGFINSGQDSFLEGQFMKIKKDQNFNILIENCELNKDLKLNDIYYIYRWGGMPCHLSVQNGKKNQLEIIEKELKKRKDRKTGIIKLVPRWEEDYVDLVNKFINANK